MPSWIASLVCTNSDPHVQVMSKNERKEKFGETGYSYQQINFNQRIASYNFILGSMGYTGHREGLNNHVYPEVSITTPVISWIQMFTIPAHEFVDQAPSRFRFKVLKTK